MAKLSRKKLYIGIAVAVVVVIALVAMVSSRKGEKPIEVTTDKAVRKSITQLVTATGKIQPEVEVKIAPEVSGEIVEIPVKEGQLVKKGQLLLRIKPDSYQAQVASQQASYNSARSASTRNRAELERAESEYRRVQSLYDRGLVSEAERRNASLHEAYQAAGGVRGDPVRKRLYQLYHLLNHVVLFGGAWRAQALDAAGSLA